ncbi:S-layer homology domain-containing protein [Paenibacillus sp. R14(2021)]|uniref:S-layer homology domain-containing protein n=1 Tax=Paenibacillus sp. R14(2021) TaxID=2859228 RepID=UPI001C6117B2|nr:S-layer homology domain-containing protein [Paenibacillus sp. R14(2021)]
MPHHKKWVKVVSSFMVFSLLTGFSAVGANSAHADAVISSRFSDVPSGHWAEKHIAKLATQGIIKGTNGAFKPADNVSQQEAVALAIRFIGKENEVKVDDAIVFPESFDVSTYFKPYIILAFEQGLLNRNEEFKLAEADTGKSWGSKKASREWITKLIVKAIGKQKTADDMQSAPLAFKDGNQVGTGYAGYVNAAVTLQLIKGITADKFDPKGNITRAAIATMLSRAESQYPVTYPGQLTGVLTSKDSKSLQIFQGDKETAVQFSPDTYVYRFDSEKPATLDQLVSNTKLLVIASGSKALYVEQLDDVQQVEKVTGTVDRVIANDSKLWIWVNDEPVAITYSAATKITDGSGNVIPVSSLAKDSKVEITRDTYRTKPVAISISVQSAPVNKVGQGTVDSVQASSAAIQITDSKTSVSALYNVSAQVDVIWQGQILDGGLSQLRVGDVVSYEVKDSLVTKITILQTSSKVVRGEFNSASSDGKTIQYLRNSGTAQQVLEAKFVIDAVDVTIDGLSGTTVSDLVKGDMLEITLNDNDQVAAIKVINRKVEVLTGATIVSYDNDLKALLVKSAANKLVSVYLSDKTKIDMNGTPITLSSVATFLIKNKKITVGYTDDKAVFIQFVYKYTGTITSINSGAGQITMLQTNGASVTVPLDTPYYIEVAGKASALLSDVKSGDTVTALLNANQDKVVGLQVHSAKQVEVYSVDLLGKKVKLKSSDGTIIEYAASALDLTNEKGDKLTVANITAGQVGNLYYVGLSPVSFKVVTVTTGRITSVSTDKVTIVDYSGNAVNVPLGLNYSVVKNGVTGTSASVLAPGDRVEAKLDAKDKFLITVNSGVAKTFWKYDAAAHVLSVKRVSLSDANTYTVTSATKVTQGNASISINQLADGDNIVLYFSQNTLIEIVKL